MKKLLIIIVALLSLSQAAEAQVTKAKAMLTLNFIRYIGWPDAARQGDFVIGVVKSKELVNQLTAQSTGKKFGFQDIVVKEFKNVEEITNCQVVYVSSMINFSRSAGTIINKAGKGALIVTEQDGATDSGSMINFVVKDGKLMFELHKNNASLAGVHFSTKLENMTAAINL